MPKLRFFLKKGVDFTRMRSLGLLLFGLLGLTLSCTQKAPESQLENLPPEQKIVRVKALYLMRCASCHGENGEGRIGPNLADEYWINGDRSKASVLLMISEGQVKKGMPAWKHVFHPKDLEAIADLVMSFQGTNPANAKAPQGEKK